MKKTMRLVFAAVLAALLLFGSAFAEDAKPKETAAVPPTQQQTAADDEEKPQAQPETPKPDDSKPADPTLDDPKPADPADPGEEEPCAHEKTVEKVVKEAKCEEAGEKQLVCEKCGEAVKTEEIPALGHDFKWKTVKEATAEAEGLRQSVCSRCGKVDKEEKIPKLTAQMMINNAICAQGLLLRDYRPDLTSRWYMVTPIDLSQDGVQEFRLIIGYTRYAGTVTVTVKDGKATVNYRIQYPATMRDMAFTLLPDLDSLTNAELKKGQKTYKFGQEIDIASELNGDTSALLYVLGHGDYDYLTKDLDWFLPSSAAYRKTVEQLKGLMQ